MNGQESSIKMRGFVKRYGERTVVNGVSPRCARRSRRSARPQRRGQDDHVLHGRGLGEARRRHGAAGHAAKEDRSHRALRCMRARATASDISSQENSIFRKLSVGDNIRLIWEQNGMPHDERERRLPALLEEFGLREFVNARGDSLSGGERRRVEIARALAIEPAFLLLDEPFTGIDPIAVADIQTMIRQLRDRGFGILITDHQVRETLAIVDRAYIMNNGRIEVSGTRAGSAGIADRAHVLFGRRLSGFKRRSHFMRDPALLAIHDSRPLHADANWRGRSCSACRAFTLIFAATRFSTSANSSAANTRRCGRRCSCLYGRCRRTSCS